MDKFESLFAVWIVVPAISSIVLSIVHAQGVAGWQFFTWCLATFAAVLLVTSLIKKSGLGHVSKSKRNTLWLILLVPVQALLYAFIMSNIQVVAITDSVFVALINTVIYLAVFYSVIYGGTWVIAIALNKGKVKTKK